MDRSSRDRFRDFLKDTVRQKVDFNNTDQNRGIAPPPLEKPIPAGAQCIDLVPAEKLRDISVMDVFTAIANRRSRRVFNPVPLTLKELSFLLWATQGVRKIAAPGNAFRVVPSAGCRHALETYLCVFNVAGLGEGIYRYLPLEHQLLPFRSRHTCPPGSLKQPWARISSGSPLLRSYGLPYPIGWSGDTI